MLQLQKDPRTGRFLPGHSSSYKGKISPQARNAHIAARLTFGVSSSILALPTENRHEVERFVAGYIDTWQPVGQHETECVINMARGYWRLRRLERYVTGTTYATMIIAAGNEPEEVRKQIGRLLGVRIPPRTDDHKIDLDAVSIEDDEVPFYETSSWWESILHGSPERELSGEQVQWLIDRLFERVLPEGDESESSFQITVASADGNEPADVDSNGLSAVPDEVTVGELRDQLRRIGQAFDSADVVAAIVAEGLESARVIEERTRLAAEEAKRFIESRLMPAENVMSSTAIFERALLIAITRHMNMLVNLQARRRGEFVPPPVTLDVNVTTTAE